MTVLYISLMLATCSTLTVCLCVYLGYLSVFFVVFVLFGLDMALLTGQIEICQETG